MNSKSLKHLGFYSYYTLMLLSETNKHERDQHIKFFPEPHEYTIHGKKANKSVTTLIHEYFPSFDQENIANYCFKKAKTNPKSDYKDMSVEDILQKWETNKNEACESGTFLHETIEKVYNSEEVVNDTIEFSYFKNFYKDFSHLEAYRTEWEIYHEEANLAGSIDMVFKNPDGSFSIYDWKRSKKIEKHNRFESGEYPVDHLPHSNFWHYSLQLNTYKYILEEKYNIFIKDLYLVICHPNNSNYQRIEVPNLQNEIKEIFLEQKSPKEQKHLSI